jgi:hypothetical protein
MPEEIWFRGEVRGMDPARPGAFVHELGDGMYLTDKEDVAWLFATKMRDPAAQVLDINKHMVYELRVERSRLGRVLDLSTDPRWRRFLSLRQPRSGMTNEQLARQTPQNYYGLLQGFLQQNKLDPESFDAIIGPNYLQGGRMLCVVNKKGSPALLQFQLRTIFKPVVLREARETAMGKLTSVGPIEGGQSRVVPIRASGVATKQVTTILAEETPQRAIIRTWLRGITTTVSLFLFGLLISYVRQKLEQSLLIKQIEELEPRIDREISSQVLFTANLLYRGIRPFANITMTILTFYHVETDGSFAYRVYDAPAVSPDIDVRVTGTVKNGPGPSTAGFVKGQTVDVDSFTFSIELGLSDEAMEFYRSTIAELEWYQEKLNNPAIFSRDIDRMLRERQEIIKNLGDYFGVAESAVIKHLKDVGLVGL